MGLRIAVGGGGGKRRKRGNLRGIKGELDVVVCRAMLKNCQRAQLRNWGEDDAVVHIIQGGGSNPRVRQMEGSDWSAQGLILGYIS